MNIETRPYSVEQSTDYDKLFICVMQHGKTVHITGCPRVFHFQIPGFSRFPVTFLQVFLSPIQKRISVASTFQSCKIIKKRQVYAILS